MFDFGSAVEGAPVQRFAAAAEAAVVENQAALAAVSAFAASTPVTFHRPLNSCLTILDCSSRTKPNAFDLNYKEMEGRGLRGCKVSQRKTVNRVSILAFVIRPVQCACI